MSLFFRCTALQDYYDPLQCLWWKDQSQYEAVTASLADLNFLVFQKKEADNVDVTIDEVCLSLCCKLECYSFIRSEKKFHQDRKYECFGSMGHSVATCCSFSKASELLPPVESVFDEALVSDAANVPDASIAKKHPNYNATLVIRRAKNFTDH